EPFAKMVRRKSPSTQDQERAPRISAHRKLPYCTSGSRQSRQGLRLRSFFAGAKSSFFQQLIFGNGSFDSIIDSASLGDSASRRGRCKRRLTSKRPCPRHPLHLLPRDQESGLRETRYTCPKLESTGRIFAVNWKGPRREPQPQKCMKRDRVV